jgi:hypothetical protein
VRPKLQSALLGPAIGAERDRKLTLLARASPSSCCTPPGGGLNLASFFSSLRYLHPAQSRSCRTDTTAVQWVEHGRGTRGLLDPIELANAEAWDQTDSACDLGQSANGAALRWSQPVELYMTSSGSGAAVSH